MPLPALCKRPLTHLSLALSCFAPGFSGFCSKVLATGSHQPNIGSSQVPTDNRLNPEVNFCSRLHLSPLFSDSRTYLDVAYNIEVVDDDDWKVSACLARAWQQCLDVEAREKLGKDEVSGQDDDATSFVDDLDADEIDNMRIRGNLFYKLDRDSKEFEECSFDFHRRKSSNKKDDPKGKIIDELSEKKKDKKDDSKGKKEGDELSKKNEKNKDDNKNGKLKKKLHVLSASGAEELPKIVNNGKVYYSLVDNVDGSAGVEKKKIRTPTFNQLTGPYHEPFCLDIYISKASVRACIVHRVTSKVVAVAHSISKDMKSDLASTRNVVACTAVGEILAQRALADDIHDVVYTPRKGDRVEGKLQVVLQSIMDNGVNVKVKLKQRNRQKAKLWHYV